MRPPARTASTAWKRSREIRLEVSDTEATKLSYRENTEWISVDLEYEPTFELDALMNTLRSVAESEGRSHYPDAITLLLPKTGARWTTEDAAPFPSGEPFEEFVAKRMRVEAHFARPVTEFMSNEPVRAPIADDLDAVVADLERIAEYFRANDPSVVRRLLPGASDEAIARAEAAIGWPLPESARALFRFADGQLKGEPGDNFGFLFEHRLFSLDEAVERHRDPIAQGFRGQAMSCGNTTPSQSPTRRTSKTSGGRCDA